MKILFVTDILNLYVKRDPLGLMYLSASCKKAGHETLACGTNIEMMEKAVDAFSPDILGYSVTHPSFNLLRDVYREIKKRRPGSFISVFGGPQATFSPEIIQAEGIDAVCIGEGENAFVDFVNRLEYGSSLQGTMNFWIKQKGKIDKNHVRPLIDDIDSIPFCDRELMAGCDPSWRDYPIKSFLQSRGCPFDCSFCHNKSWRDIYKGKGLNIRRRSVDNLLEELSRVRKEGNLQFVLFTADTFILSKKWLVEFSEKYSKEINLPFYCMVRADLIDSEVALLLKKAGAFSVGMGIESGNPHVRERVLKKGLSNKEIIQAAKIIHDHKINLYTFNMLAIPGTTFEDDLSTLDLNIAIRADYPMATFATPYPKTEFYEKALELGLFEDGELDYTCSYYDKTLLKGKDQTRVENLMYLFALAVSFPSLRNLVIRLSKINGGPVYYALYRVLKGYFSWTRIFPHNLGTAGFLKAAFRYLFRVHR